MISSFVMFLMRAYSSSTKVEIPASNCSFASIPCAYDENGMSVLVVGGGDSALEAALDISAEPGTTVTLCYRGKAFDRVKPKNRARLEEAVANQHIQQLMETTVKKIEADRVILAKGEEAIELPNDAIIVCAASSPRSSDLVFGPAVRKAPTPTSSTSVAARPPP